MQSIMLEAIDAYRVEVDAGRTTLEELPGERGATVTYNVHVGDDLYEWLRTTAFYQRTSMTAMIVAALTSAQADHAEGTRATDAD